MRSDGAVTYFFIQHHEAEHGRWVESSLDHLLFRNMSGAMGNQYRALLKPQSASSALWQKYDIHGYSEADYQTARLTLDVVRDANPGMMFRIVKRTMMQMTEVVE